LTKEIINYLGFDFLLLLRWAAAYPLQEFLLERLHLSESKQRLNIGCFDRDGVATKRQPLRLSASLKKDKDQYNNRRRNEINLLIGINFLRFARLLHANRLSFCASNFPLNIAVFNFAKD